MISQIEPVLYTDPQAAKPAGFCRCCGGELYLPGEYCPECGEEP